MSRITNIDGRRFAQFVCGKCGIEHWVPEAFYDEQVKLGPSGGWYCPNGHRRVFRESAADQLRRERDRLQQQLAQKDDAIAYQREQRERAERSAAAYKGQTTRLKKRAKAGVCPCCNRTFENLARHMATQHPEMDPNENVVEFEPPKKTA